MGTPGNPSWFTVPESFLLGLTSREPEDENGKEEYRSVQRSRAVVPLGRVFVTLAGQDARTGHTLQVDEASGGGTGASTAPCPSRSSDRHTLRFT